MEREDLPLHLDLHGLVRHALPVADGGLQHLDHHRAALERGGLGGLDPAGLHAGEEVGLRTQQHARLGQGGQHVGDVAQERGVRADQQHAAGGEFPPVRVEQVRRPVQRHRRLAGARAALDHQHTGQRRADDLVLFDLDGLDDVPHAAGAPGVQRGQQRRLAGQFLVAGGGGGGDVEHLVVEAGHLPLPGAQVPPPAYALRVGGGGEVERARGRGAPVDQQRVEVAVTVEDADAADVVAGAVLAVEATEAEPFLHGGELLDLFGVHAHGTVALRLGLAGPAGRPQLLGEPAGGLLTQLVEAVVEHGDVLLLAPDLVVERQFAGNSGVP